MFPLLSGIATSAYEVPSRLTRPFSSLPLAEARSASGSLTTSLESPRWSESAFTSMAVWSPPAIGLRKTTRAPEAWDA